MLRNIRRNRFDGMEFATAEVSQSFEELPTKQKEEGKGGLAPRHDFSATISPPQNQVLDTNTIQTRTSTSTRTRFGQTQHDTFLDLRLDF